jgi:hypothetical protein
LVVACVARVFLFRDAKFFGLAADQIEQEAVCPDELGRLRRL